MCLKNIESPIVTTRTAIFPTSDLRKGLNKNISNKPPKTPQIIIEIIIENVKFIPKGEYLSKNNTLESIGFEKKSVMIAPNAIISPWAKLTILVTPYSKESATEATEIIIPSNSPFPNCSIIVFYPSLNITCEPSIISITTV